MHNIRPVLLLALLFVFAAMASAAPPTQPVPGVTPEFLAMIGAAPAGSGCGTSSLDVTRIGVPTPQWQCPQPCTSAITCPACPGAGCFKACVENCCDCLGDC